MPNYDSSTTYPSATFANSNIAFGSKKIPGTQRGNIDDRVVVSPVERKNEFGLLKTALSKLGWQLRPLLREMQMDVEIEYKKCTRTQLADTIRQLKDFAEKNARMTLQMKKDQIIVLLGKYYRDQTLAGFLADWNLQFPKATGLRLTQESLYENDVDLPGLDTLLEHLLAIQKSPS
jgi:hypothetical protein